MIKLENDNRIHKVNASNLVCNKMKEFIANGTWKLNERIPSENDLARMFDVSRLTVRLALQKLNTLGIINTRVGDGTYVTSFNFREHIQQISEFYKQSGLIDDVYEFRKAIELSCLRLAVERGLPEEFAKLKELSDQFTLLCDETQQQIKNDPNCIDDEQIKTIANIDMEFHYEICKISRNKLLTYSFSVARETIYDYLFALLKKRLINGVKSEEYKNMSAHKVIYNAIMNKDLAAAEKAFLNMLDFDNEQ